MSATRAAFSLLLIAFLARAAGATNVSGALTSSTTWTAANNPYVVTSTVTVNSGVTLTIEPGVVVKFNSSTGLTVSGTLSAIGTSTSRITFTSSAATPTAGAWRAILLQAPSTQTASQISYADVSYGGASGTGLTHYAAIDATNGAPTLTNVTVTNSFKSGAYAAGASTTLNMSGCALTSNGEYGINLDAGATLNADQTTITSNTKHAVSTEPGTTITALSNATATGNGAGAKNAIEYRGGSMTASETWGAYAIPWDVTSTATIAAGAVLTIEPGATVRFGAAGLTVSGSLKAIGTATSRITFTSTSATPTAGAWRALVLQAPATQPVTEIAYADVQYGGAGYTGVTYYGTIHVTNGSPTLTNVTVSNSYRSGAYAAGAATTLNMTGCALTSNAEYGVNLDAGATLNADQTTFTSNTKHAVGAEPGTKVNALSNVTATGNGGGAKNAIEYRGSSLTASETWGAFSIPWDVVSTPTIAAGAVLTIAPGATVRFGTAGLTVNGSLKAIGTATSRITFTSTSATPAAGAWRVLLLQAPATQPVTEIAYADVLYGGAQYTGVDYYGSIHVTNGAPVLTNVTVSNSSRSGVYATGAATTLNMTGCVLTANTEYGINLDAGATLNADQTTITSNTKYAVGAEPGTKITALSNVTASGNGAGAKNSIEYRGGSMTASETWGAFGIPWDVVSTPTVAAGAMLTIAPGATVRFGTAGLTINGSLKAIGTPTSRITFTSTSATPAAGAWRVLLLQAPSTQPVTEIAYADVLYGGAQFTGASYYGSINVTNGAPTLTNVTVSNSSKSGVYATGATTTLNMLSCQLSANAEYGVNLATGATLSADQMVLTNNTKHAVGAEPGTDILLLSNVTATGNGAGAKNSIEYRGGTMAASETWRPCDLPRDVITSTTVAAGAVLTITPGTLVRFGASSGLAVSGALKAIGTSTERITFTSSAATPTPGSWRVILLQAASTQPLTEIAYADISYGGANGGSTYYGNINVTSGVVLIEHVTSSASVKSGAYISGGATVTMRYCALTGNTLHGLEANGAGVNSSVRYSTFSGNGTNGLRNTTPGTPMNALFNYWNAASGPSGSGSGSGQSVTTGVLFEPWIVASPVQSVHSFASATHMNRTFNAAIGAVSTLDFASVAEGAWTVELRNSANQVVRTFSGQDTAASVTWDGTDASSVAVAGGNYSYTIASIDAGSTAATLARGLFIVDLSKTVAVTAISITEAYFSPNGDTTKDTTTVSATTNYQDAVWSVDIRNPGGTTVRTVSSAGTGATVAFIWDGAGDDTTIQPGNTYTVLMTATVGGDNDTRSTTVRLDNVAPVVAVTSPASGTPVSNIYLNGGYVAAVNGSVSDAVSLSNWTVDYAPASNPTLWTNVATGTTAKSNVKLGDWSTAGFQPEVYTLRLRGWDKAGNLATASGQFTVGHLTGAQSPFYINSATTGSVTYTSVVPFDLTVSLKIRNSIGTVVRTLYSALRTAGNYTDVWDGKDDAGNVLPDGPYSYVITGTTGSVSATFDESNIMRGTGEGSIHPTVRPVFDPYNNKNQAFTVTITDAYRTVLEVSTVGNYSMNCTNRPGCLTDNEYLGPGTYTFSWAGTSRTGAFLPDKNRAGFHYSLAKFPRNVTALYGTKPVLLEPFVAPPLYSPSSGQQTVSFDLTTYQSAPATVSVRFLNQESLSVLRTIVGQQSAGRVSVTWDGRADNGAWVAPGDYTVMIDATDALGNTATLHAVMTIIY